MKIICPHCNFTKEIDETKVPANAKRATCPKCKQKFDLFPAGGAEAGPPPITPERGTTSPPPRPETPQGPAPARPGPVPPPMPEVPAGFAPQAGRQGMEAAMAIPWEARSGGFFSDLFGTMKMVLFSPSRFFNAMPTSGGLKGPMIFSMVFGTMGAIFFVISVALFLMLFMNDYWGTMLGPAMGEAQLPVALPMTIIYSLMIGFVVISPLLFVIWLLFNSAITHLFLMIVRGAGGGYEATFRVIAYCQATLIFLFIPVVAIALIGIFQASPIFLFIPVSAFSIIGIYSFVLLLFGLPRAHNVGVGRVLIGVVVVPIALSLLLNIGMAIILPMLIGGM